MMSRRIIIMMSLLFALMIMAIQASAAFPYFLQDDYIYDPASAGNKLVADGRILSWNQKQVIAWFEMTAATVISPMVSEEIWQLEFKDGFLNIYDANPLSPLWKGTFDSMIVRGKTNGVFDVATEGFPRPSYENQPTEYELMGTLIANKIAGTWQDQQISIELGFYNIATVAGTQKQMGNMQGRLTIVPEPGTIAALITGMASLGGLAIKKFRR